MCKTSRAFADARAGGDLSDHVFLDLVGPLCLRDVAGMDLTPRGRKSQGLLALARSIARVAAQPILVAGQLWSDRPQEQGSASLRQCLTRSGCVWGHTSDAS